MSEFYPYFTNDGSVGLYSPEFNDIYHSATGALSEAFDKFINPSNIDYLMQTKQEIKVLDICYGIGYNTKAFLNFIFENNFKKFAKSTHCYAPIYTNKKSSKVTNNYGAIHTDNNTSKNSKKLSDEESNNFEYNAEIHSDKVLPKIFIKAIDFDKTLTLLSPFVKTGERNFKKYNKSIPNEKITKYIENGCFSGIKQIDNLINYLLFQKITEQMPEIYQDVEVNSILNNDKLMPFFDSDLRGIFKFYQSSLSNYNPVQLILSFLHNIYYHHISDRYKKRLKRYLLCDIDFELKNDDARKIILNDSNIYNLIFLDAFTPSKCPCLWSYDFFKLLFEHLESDGMILTYSSSASIRGAMLEAGFQIGNIFNEKSNQFMGTVAVKDKSLIKYPLSEFDLGLIKSKAGIFYRDSNLNAQNEAIIEARNLEVQNSNRISSSAFKKNFNNNFPQ